MKVCLISSLYPPRITGPATQTRHLALLLRQHGLDPFVVTFGEGGDAMALNEGVKVYYLNPHEEPVVGPLLQYAHAAIRLWKIMRVEKPDIVHFQSGVDYLCVVTGALIRRLGIPAMVKYAGDLVWERIAARNLEEDAEEFIYDDIFRTTLKGRILSRMERYALNSFGLVWAPSSFQADSLLRLLHVEPNKVVCHPNYIALQPPAVTQRSSDRLVVLSVCRFARWKRLDRTLQVFSKIDNKGAILRIVGGENPTLEKELRGLATRLGIEDRVDFVGAVSPERIHSYFQEADVFLSSSTYEPFGIVFVEAMAAGLPVLATRVGGIPEVVPDGQAGFLLEPGDIDGMAARLQLLIDDRELRECLGRYGEQWAARFDLKENIGQFIGLYTKLADSRCH